MARRGYRVWDIGIGIDIVYCDGVDLDVWMELLDIILSLRILETLRRH